jgi:hypothetical protein
MQVKRPGGVIRFACDLAAMRGVPSTVTRGQGTAHAISRTYGGPCA